MENLTIDDTSLKTKPSLFKARKLKKANRIWELDFIRGICVLLMIWDHFMFNIAEQFGAAWVTANPVHQGILDFAINYESGMLRAIFHPIIFGLFFLLCGISCNLSNNNLKRGVQALFLAFGVTAVTSMFDVPIKFGALHLLAFSILIYYIISVICRNNKRLISMVCLISGMVIIAVTQVYTKYPPEGSEHNLAFIAEYLGTGPYDSADYFPLLPHLANVLFGAAVGSFVYGERKSVLPMLDKYGWYKPISFWGDKALLIYIIHQPVIIALLSLISYLFITPGNFIFI